jgi:hypothetical protein
VRGSRRYYHVVGGQDGVVSRHSAGAGQSLNVEVIPDKGHIDIVRPSSSADISFLLVKQAALRLFSDRGDDLAELRKSVHQRDAAKVAGLVVNCGRSWIETDQAADAIQLFREIEQTFDPNSIEVIWSQYLAAIAILLRDRSAPPSAFDSSFLAREPPGQTQAKIPCRYSTMRTGPPPWPLHFCARKRCPGFF